MPPTDLQVLISTRIRQIGAAAMARELGVNSNCLLTYVAGRARQGTRALIELRVAERYRTAERREV